MTAAEYRRQLEHQQRWHTVGAALCLAVVVGLVYWLLPLPAVDRTQSASRPDQVAGGTKTTRSDAAPAGAAPR